MARIAGRSGSCLVFYRRFSYSYHMPSTVVFELGREGGENGRISHTLAQIIEICRGYIFKKQWHRPFLAHPESLQETRAFYEKFDDRMPPAFSIRSFIDFPGRVEEYLQSLLELCSQLISMLVVGTDKGQTFAYT